MLGNAAYLEHSRRESRKRRRLSERRRVFSRLGGPTDDFDSQYGGQSSFSTSRDRRRPSNMTATRQQTDDVARSDSPTMLTIAGDQSKIAMKIQFYITVAPDNEPLILDTYQLVTSPPQPTPAAATTTATSTVPPTSSGGSSAKRMSTDQSAIGEQISELLSRQSSSTRRRQQLLALHQQSAMDNSIAKQSQQHSSTSTSPSFQPTSQQQSSGVHSSAGLIHSNNNPAFIRSGSMSDNPRLGREAGARSSTITGGMQDAATMEFLAKHQPQSVARTASGALIGQHQTLMSSSSNIRHRLEQREHIYFKRDGQRFGHEFTLKLAVDKSYRCLMKVRPLIPLQAISIQGHHVSFVDCSASNSFSTSSSSSGCGSSSMSSSAPASSTTLNNGNNSPQVDIAMHFNGLRHQSVSHLNGAASLAASPASHANRHNSIGPATDLAQNQRPPGASGNQNNLLGNHYSQLRQHDQSHRRLNHAQTTIGASGARRTSNFYSDASVAGAGAGATDQDQDEALTAGARSSMSHVNGARLQLQQQLLRQQQHNQMVRHFSATHSSSSSSHLGGQLVYMFDWSASRFEVNKNKARTQVQTVLKFKNGQILSLPLQVKFYQPECKQHLSWGSQLHFIDYDCNIDSMGQMNVDRIQYY